MFNYLFMGLLTAAFLSSETKTPILLQDIIVMVVAWPYFLGKRLSKK